MFVAQCTVLDWNLLGLILALELSHSVPARPPSLAFRFLTVEGLKLGKNRPVLTLSFFPPGVVEASSLSDSGPSHGDL